MEAARYATATEQTNNEASQGTRPVHALSSSQSTALSRGSDKDSYLQCWGPNKKYKLQAFTNVPVRARKSSSAEPAAGSPCQFDLYTREKQHKPSSQKSTTCDEKKHILSQKPGPRGCGKIATTTFLRQNRVHTVRQPRRNAPVPMARFPPIKLQGAACRRTNHDKILPQSHVAHVQQRQGEPCKRRR